MISIDAEKMVPVLNQIEESEGIEGFGIVYTYT
jgi:hypothetical protein